VQELKRPHGPIEKRVEKVGETERNPIAKDTKRTQSVSNSDPPFTIRTERNDVAPRPGRPSAEESNASVVPDV
jgi:hypothetical protein